VQKSVSHAEETCTRFMSIC